MEDACYLCRRTQVDLDRLNEEFRTRAYLSYFTNARSQIDDHRRWITFLQRLKDEESGDPHFRINAKQVLSDPPAYKKMMPWIDSLSEIAASVTLSPNDGRTMADLVNDLLAEERRVAGRLEDAVDRLRIGFAKGGNSPLSLREVVRALPVEWTVDPHALAWRPRTVGEPEPLQPSPTGSKPTISITVHLCTVCEQLLGPT